MFKRLKRRTLERSFSLSTTPHRANSRAIAMTRGLNTKAPSASCCARDVGRVQCGCGVPCSKNKKSPQKVYWETCYGWATLTISALSFPQFTQMHSRIFFTLMRKPAQWIRSRHRNKIGRAGLPGWNTGRASSMWPKCPGHSAIPSPQVAHLKLRSIVPIRGS